MSTIVFVDIDGVINAIPNSGDDLTRIWPKETWRREGVYMREFGVPVMINWSTEVVDRLRALEQRDDTEMWWCTTWRENASDLLSPLIGGLGYRWPYVDRQPGKPAGQHNWWKADHVFDTIQSGRYDKVLWIDDDIAAHANILTMQGRGEDWRTMIKDGVLALSPSTTTGLTPKDFGLIEDFLQ